MPNNGDARTIVAGGGLNWMYVSPSEDGPGQVGVIDHLTTMWRRLKRWPLSYLELVTGPIYWFSDELSTLGVKMTPRRGQLSLSQQ